MNYLDVYFSRVNHFGETQAERIKNSGIVAFAKWMAQSPCTVLDLSVERGLYFSGIIETSKDREEKKIMVLYVAVDIPIKVGDIMNWRQDDGTDERWILLSKIHKTHETYQTFQIVKCNYLIKWIDKDGRLKRSWSYVVSSTDDKIKGNFRTWHNLISPQPNKYTEIIMPRQEVDRGTNFIIEDEGWQMIEADFTSVEGIIYMSLTENKVNYQYDDRDVDIADTDKLKFPELLPTYKIGESIVPLFGEFTFNEWEIELLIPKDTNIVQKDDDALVARNTGTVMITMQLKNRPAVQHKYEIRVEEVEEVINGYIAGANSIRLDRKEAYEFHSDTPINGEVTYTLEDTELAEIYDISDGKCIVKANKKNKLGSVVLHAQYSNNDYIKTIDIIPLW